jgi:hypothetical protein
MEKRVKAETRSLEKVRSDLGRERPSHFKTPREKDTSEPSCRHRVLPKLDPSFTNAAPGNSESLPIPQ